MDIFGVIPRDIFRLDISMTLPPPTHSVHNVHGSDDRFLFKVTLDAHKEVETKVFQLKKKTLSWTISGTLLDSSIIV